MPRPANPHPTDGELALLTTLWATGPCSLSALCQALPAERVPSTVATMLKVMEGKGLVVRTDTGLWKPKLTQRSATKGLVGKLLGGIFAGSASRLVSHVVESGKLAASEIAELEALLQTARRKS